MYQVERKMVDKLIWTRVALTVAGSASDKEKLASRVPAITLNVPRSNDKEESGYIKMSRCPSGTVSRLFTLLSILS